VEGVLASDASSVPVQMWAAARDGSAFVILRQDGTYSVKFVPRIKGAFWIRVSLANEEVAAAAVAWPTVRTRRPPRRVLGKAWLHECSAPAGLGFDAQACACLQVRGSPFEMNVLPDLASWVSAELEKRAKKQASAMRKPIALHTASARRMQARPAKWAVFAAAYVEAICTELLQCTVQHALQYNAPCNTRCNTTHHCGPTRRGCRYKRSARSCA
jgi:hypothetical protein